MADQCAFCMIAAGKIPSSKIYEDNQFFAFLDINPVNKGHTLLVTKRHAVTVFDLNQQELRNIGALLQSIAKGVYRATKPDGIKIEQRNGRAAGQVVDHLHFHIVPRYNGDSEQRTTKYSTPQEAEQYAHAIARGLD